jgi:hypothetical protein
MSQSYLILVFLITIPKDLPIAGRKPAKVTKYRQISN